MSFLNVKGAQISYQVVGDQGDWLTLINGHTRGKSDFKFIAKKFSESQRRVLIYDHRGAGETLSNEDFGYQDMVQDVLDLWSELAVEKTSVLGISMGGFIAQSLSLECAHIDKLVLVSTAIAKKKIKRNLPWSRDPEVLESRLKQNFSESFLIKNSALFRGMVKNILEQIAKGHFLSGAQAQDNATESFDLEQFKHIANVPTLILHGDQDQVIPIDEAHLLHSRYPHSELKIAANCGHLLLAECPGFLIAEVNDFLKRNL